MIRYMAKKARKKMTVLKMEIRNRDDKNKKEKKEDAEDIKKREKKEMRKKF